MSVGRNKVRQPARRTIKPLLIARQADASVIAAKAAVESARINLAYTKVTSPISGRIGKSNVTEGALVTNGQTTALATVQQLDPIYVDVTQSSSDLCGSNSLLHKVAYIKTTPAVPLNW